MRKKIDAMHDRFGTLPEERCVNCSNFIHGRYHTKYLSKCTVYGATHSEATDWKKGYMACGLFNKEWKGNTILHVLRGEQATKQPQDPLDGQMCFDDIFSPDEREVPRFLDENGLPFYSNHYKYLEE